METCSFNKVIDPDNVYKKLFIQELTERMLIIGLKIVRPG